MNTLVQDDPSMTLAEWQELIADLIAEHGEDATMYTDAGYNNCEIRLSV